MSCSVAIHGFKVKGKKVVRDERRLDASARQRQRPGGSKKIRLARRGQAR